MFESQHQFDTKPKTMNRITHHLRYEFPNFFHSDVFSSSVYSPNAILVYNQIYISPLSRVKFYSRLFKALILASHKSIDLEIVSLIPIDENSLRLCWNFNSLSRVTSVSKTYQGTILFNIAENTSKISQITIESVHPIPSYFPVKLWAFSKPKFF